MILLLCLSFLSLGLTQSILVSNNITQLNFPVDVSVVYITPLDHGHTDQAYELYWTYVVETNEDNIVRTCAFGKNLSYSPIRVLETNNNVIKQINMTALISLPGNPDIVPLTISYSLFQNRTYLNTTSGPLKVSRGSLYYVIYSDGWPFLDPKNKLEIHFSLASATSNQTSFGSDPQSPNIMFASIIGSDKDVFFVKLPKAASIAPINQTTKRNSPIDLNIMFSLSSRYSLMVSLKFPTYSSFVYDGLVSIDDYRRQELIRPVASNLSLVIFFVYFDWIFDNLWSRHPLLPLQRRSC